MLLSFYRYLVGILLTPRTRTAALRSLWTFERGAYGTQPSVPLSGAEMVRYGSATTWSARLLVPESALGRKRARAHVKPRNRKIKSTGARGVGGGSW
jgi:hypothetical protein